MRGVPLLDVVLGYGCNLACDYCTVSPAAPRTRPLLARSLGADEVARAIDHAAHDGFTELALTGGEPTTRDDLGALVRHARRRGFEHVKLATNGLRLAYGPYLDHLLGAGVDRFHVSMHAPDARYDEEVRRPGALALRKAAVAGLLSRGLAPMADLVLTERTLSELDAWLTSLRAEGLSRFSLWLVSLTDATLGRRELLPSLTRVAAALRPAFARARAEGFECVSLHVPRCLLPGDLAHVRHPGADRVRVVTPRETFELKQSRLTGGHHPAACEGCIHRERCPGLRADYVAVHGDGEVAAVTRAA
jgi:MoaA/NifB/PqqE/SkfB family radical SAM enzyme